MPTTEPTYGWRLPELADPPDGPSQMGNLAADIAATLAAGVPDPAATIYKNGDVSTTQSNGAWFTLTGLAVTASQGAITANSTGIVIDVAGLYLISVVQRTRNTSGNGLLGVAVVETGSGNRLLHAYQFGDQNDNQSPGGSRLARLAVGDNLRFQMYGNGLAMTIFGNEEDSALTVVRVGP
jgi:hypothetical protein